MRELSDTEIAAVAGGMSYGTAVLPTSQILVVFRKSGEGQKDWFPPVTPPAKPPVSK